MKKLRLNLDELQVSSFVAGEAATGSGTVQANITGLCSARCDTENTCGANTCGQNTCNGAHYTCALSCTDCGTYYCATGGSCDAGTCVYSCGWTACDNCQQSENEVGTCINPC